MNLPDLPSDILFHIFTLLDVRDLLVLRKVCKLLETVTRERSVWHNVLSVHFLNSGLSVPGIKDRDICSLTLEELERLAVRAYRLWSNWTSLQPRYYKRINIRPTARPWSNAAYRNLAAEFLPGWDGRYLLTLTLYDSSSERDNRRYSFECWDVSGIEAVRAAELLVAGLLGYAINTVPGSPYVLAITRREARNVLAATTYTIDFSTTGVEPWFRRTNHFDTYRNILGLHGSYCVTTDADHEVRLIDVDSGQVTWSLKVPLIHADLTLRFPEHQCMDYQIFNGYILTFCKQWIFLYQLPAPTPSAPTPTETASPAPRLDPVARYKWRWRIDSISLNPRMPVRQSTSTNTSPTFPPIDLLIRFDTWYPWPVNILHHFVLPPSPLAPFPSSTSDPAPPTFPYLSSPADAPFMIQSVPSPLRLFTPSDMALGSSGTAVWLDASTDATTPSQAGDRGQRIVLKHLSHTPLVRRLEHATDAGVGHVGTAGGEDRVNPELGDPALLSAMVLDSESGLKGVGVGSRAGVSVLHMQETHELWNRVAVNEEEGQVAVGHVDGRVSVYSYAPIPIE